MKKLNGRPGGGMPIAPQKYKQYSPIHLNNRQWPDQVISAPPIWCSVDLRDGNQALIDPMGHERKSRMFKLLLDMGFQEIEIGFPSASKNDFDFTRWCVQEAELPSNVSLQVLVQCRKELIDKTFQSLEGCQRAIVHFYNSTSTLQCRVVFNEDVAGIKKIATDAAKLIVDQSTRFSGDCQFQYSPESFTGTELEVALEICNAVAEVIQPTSERKLIINLPSTVEMGTPNIYADQIEWMCKNLDNRENLVISVHPHNDRGTGVAAAEMGLMAGADRVEGTLFGNGERTGNADIVTLALNLFSQGIDPGLDCSDLKRMQEVYEFATQLKIPERHPYVGELVYTAFSGSHQDAIDKGMRAIRQSNVPYWEVPYLPVDPQDLGRSYKAIIRINSQSGKGGIGYILAADHGLNPPKKLKAEFRNIVQQIADTKGQEISSQKIYDEFRKNYIELENTSVKLLNFRTYPDENQKGQHFIEAEMTSNGQEVFITGNGTGPIDGFVNAMSKHLGVDVSVIDYSEHSLQTGSDASAVCYTEVNCGEIPFFGVGIHANIVMASLLALTVAINRFILQSKHCRS